jgi:hypothetical protein
LEVYDGKIKSTWKCGGISNDIRVKNPGNNILEENPRSLLHCHYSRDLRGNQEMAEKRHIPGKTDFKGTAAGDGYI